MIARVDEIGWPLCQRSTEVAATTCLHQRGGFRKSLLRVAARKHDNPSHTSYVVDDGTWCSL